MGAGLSVKEGLKPRIMKYWDGSARTPRWLTYKGDTYDRENGKRNGGQRMMGQTLQQQHYAEQAGEEWTNRVLIATPFESECEALCISASPGQPDPRTCQSWWCLVLRAHADGPHPRARLRLVGFAIKGKADGENEQQTVSQMTVMIQICWPRPCVPRWYDFVKRRMIQTNKSTPLPHNSLSLHLFLSSSCCRQDCAIYTLTHTRLTSLTMVCLLLNVNSVFISS